MARREPYLLMYLHAVRARRIFLGAHMMVDVWNNFQSRFHMTEFMSKIPGYSSNSQTSPEIDLGKVITMPI